MRKKIQTVNEGNVRTVDSVRQDITGKGYGMRRLSGDRLTYTGRVEISSANYDKKIILVYFYGGDYIKRNFEIEMESIFGDDFRLGKEGIEFNLYFVNRRMRSGKGVNNDDEDLRDMGDTLTKRG